MARPDATRSDERRADLDGHEEKTDQRRRGSRADDVEGRHEGGGFFMGLVCG
jgi:hypothetical protein